MRIASAGYRHTLPLLAALLLAFFIPAPFLLGSVGMIAVVSAMLVLRGKVIFRNFRNRKLLWAPVALYLWTLASWLWSVDNDEASAILSTKLPLLLLPITLGSSGIFRKKEGRKVFFAFSMGLAVTALYCVGRAWYRYRADGELSHFFYHPLVAGLDANAVYMAWYVVAALLFLLLSPLPDTAGARREAWVRGGLLAVLLPFFLLLSARTLLVTFVAIALPVALVFSFRKKVIRPQKFLIWIFTAAIVLAGIFAVQQPTLQARFRELGHSRPGLSYLEKYQGEEAYFSNMNIRLFLWRVGLKSMLSSPQNVLIGAGVGDAHEAIHEQVRALGIPNVEKDSPNRSVFYNINLHNTFLHIALATGLVGLLLVVVMVASLLLSGLRHYQQTPFLLLFALLSAIFMMQEAVLETQAGTVFYIFFYCLFVDFIYNKKGTGHVSF